MMNKQIKTVLSVLLAVLILLSVVPVGMAADASAALYGVYSDGMLFKQNSEAVFAGTAGKDAEISCVLSDKDGNVISQGEDRTKSDGTFSVTVKTPKGGYSEYNAVFCVNGREFRTIKNIVFGELWLAGGQSNMLLTLEQSIEGREMKANGIQGSRWIRFLSAPIYPEYNGNSENVPLNPQCDLKGCKWIAGDELSVYNLSAIAYFFAAKLQKSLDVPIGVIDTSVGGSAVASWLSREAIDGDKAVKDILIKRGSYIPTDKWDETTCSIYTDMSGNFNKKIAPLKNFRLSGMLWYQGEADIMLGSYYGEYSKQIDLLQRSYSNLFQYDGTLPIVFTQLASYGYSDDFRLQLFNTELAQFQNADENSRALMSIYDVDLIYDKATGPIHPITKEIAGERMAFCAEGLVYGKNSIYTAATVKTVRIDDSAVYVSFKNTGDKLICDSDTIRGFSVCGENGIYLPAQAEIISDDTVKIANDNVKNPVSAAYAVSQSNGRSNLYASDNGYRMPVSPFITDMEYSENLWKDNGWTDCDCERIWRTHTDELAGYYDIWSAENAVCRISADSAYSGDGGLSVVSSDKIFLVKPILTDKNGQVLFDIDNDLSKFKTLSFKIRNNSSIKLYLNCLKITNGAKWVAPVVLGDDICSAEIPPDGQWHTVTFDLTILYQTADVKSKADSATLNCIDGLCFCFESVSADLSIDDFEFTAGEKENTKKLSFAERIKAFFQRIIDFFKKIFRVK